MKLGEVMDKIDSFVSVYIGSAVNFLYIGKKKQLIDSDMEVIQRHYGDIYEREVKNIYAMIQDTAVAIIVEGDERTNICYKNEYEMWRKDAFRKRRKKS